MYEYLRLGEVAVLYPGVLFLHGAITPENAGRVPTQTDKRGGDPTSWRDSYTLQPNLKSWVASMNKWHAQEFGNLIKGTEEGAPWGDRPWSSVGYGGPKGEGLLQYGMGSLPAAPGGVPVLGNNPSVVVKTWVDNGMPRDLEDEVVTFLRSSGVSTVVCGHMPHGDAPLVWRQHGITIVTADTSYSNDVIYDGVEREKKDASNRGPDAVPVVVLEVEEGKQPTVEVEAVLSTGETLKASLPSCEHTGTLKDGWLVKGKVGDKWLVSHGVGFTITNRLAAL